MCDDDENSSVRTALIRRNVCVIVMRLHQFPKRPGWCFTELPLLGVGNAFRYIYSLVVVRRCEVRLERSCSNDDCVVRHGGAVKES